MKEMFPVFCILLTYFVSVLQSDTMVLSLSYPCFVLRVMEEVFKQGSRISARLYDSTHTFPSYTVRLFWPIYAKICQYKRNCFTSFRFYEMYKLNVFHFASQFSHILRFFLLQTDSCTRLPFSVAIDFCIFY